jgi:hypothetical protein
VLYDGLSDYCSNSGFCSIYCHNLPLAATLLDRRNGRICDVPLLHSPARANSSKAAKSVWSAERCAQNTSPSRWRVRCAFRWRWGLWKVPATGKFPQWTPAGQWCSPELFHQVDPGDVNQNRCPHGYDRCPSDRKAARIDTGVSHGKPRE